MTLNSHLIVKLSEKSNRPLFYHTPSLKVLSVYLSVNNYKALDRSLLPSERNREDEDRGRGDDK